MAPQFAMCESEKNSAPQKSPSGWQTGGSSNDYKKGGGKHKALSYFLQAGDFLKHLSAVEIQKLLLCRAGGKLLPYTFPYSHGVCPKQGMGLSRAVGGEYLFSFNFTNGVNVQVGGHVPYQAAPEARLQAQPVAGLVVPQ